MNAQAAQEMGLHIGSVIQIPFYTDHETQTATSYANLGKPFLTIKIKMVGEVIPQGDVVLSDIDSLGAAQVIFSPALARALAPECTTGTEVMLQLRGGDHNNKRVFAAANRIDPDAAQFGEEVISSFIPAVQQAIEPEAIALAVFGGISGLAVLMIVALMLGRSLRMGTEETTTLRALGANRYTLLADQLIGVLASVITGALLAVAVAVTLSPLAPLGPVRPVYPHLGVDVDWTVLGFGFLILVLGLGTLALLFARRELRRITSHRLSQGVIREPRLVRSLANSGLPTSVLTGVRFALDPGRGEARPPFAPPSWARYSRSSC